MRLILIRHGEPDYEHDTLTEKGWREAGLLAERVKDWNVRDIYLSPLGRAQDTAKPSLRALGREGITLPWLQEYRARIVYPGTYTDKDGLTVPWDFLPEFWTGKEELFCKDTWMDAPVMKTGKGNVRSIYEEACRGLDDLLAGYGYRRDGMLYRAEKAASSGTGEEGAVVLFCHMGIICVMLSHLLGIAFPPLIHGLFLAPSSVTVLAAEERDPGTAYFRCQMIGDTSHLRAAGEPASMAGYFAEPFQG